MRFLGLGYPIIYEHSVLWGYSPVPNQTERRFKDSRVTIDQNGFRIARLLEGDSPILFFGDSITYGGSYIDDKYIFSSLACEMLNAQTSRSKYSCANAAVNAYGIRNMLSRATYVEKQFPTAVIVLTVISDDFYRNFSQLSGLPYFSTKLPEPFPAIMELLAYSLDMVRNWMRFRSSVGSQFGEMPAARIEVDTVVDSLNEFIKRRKHEGKHTILLWSPSRYWFNGTQGEKERYPYDRLRKLGIEFIDMTYVLKKTNVSASEIYYDDTHLQQEGHRLYAQIVADSLGNGADFKFHEGP